MIGVELALLILIAGAFLCLATLGRPAWARVVGPTVAVLGCAAGLIPSATVLIGAAPISLRLPWLIPLGSLSLEMDALSAVFAVPILLITALAAVYGAEYLRPYEGKKETSASWFFFNMLTASMLLVVLARNALLFLLAWEIMSLASFFLVMFEHEKESVQRAGWVYLIATHIGTAFILVLFVLLGRQSGTLDFVGFSLTQAAPALAATIFILATIGFGTKAGFIPVHVWLPEAHPAAPSHVSAVMSGVMIKTGVYGLVRVLTFLGTPPYWFGWTLVGVGAVSGILGVLFALAQHDLKRLLAYSSVENIGIIALGLGIGLLGVSCDSPIMATLGFAGALLHVINHAIFKSLLFLGAGSVLHACGTRDMNRLGGLLRRMRVTGLIILVGSAAICGLPPLNGFVSEFMIYFGALTGLATTPDGAMGGLAAALIVATGSLALIGGLAVVCFTKAFGMVFLGEQRSAHTTHAHEAGPAMQVPMAILAVLCVVIGLSGPLLLPLIQPAVSVVAGMSSGVALNTAWIGRALWMLASIAVGAVVLATLLAFLRARLLRGRSVNTTVTWDCGYAAPSPRMQYSASSFADPVTRMFRAFLRTSYRHTPPSGLFPESASFASHTPDVLHDRMYRPVFSLLAKSLARFRWLQHGRVNLYVLYIMLALLGLLAWKLM